MTLSNVRNTLAIALVAMLFAFGLASVVQADEGTAGTIGTEHIGITEKDHSLTERTVRAFIPTGSNQPCLVSLAESNYAQPGTTVFCAPRVVDDVEGVSVHLFSATEIPDGARWLVAVHQDKAKFGEPVAYSGP